MHIPQKAKIEEIGINSIEEIENHRISGAVFVQYRLPIQDLNGKEIDVIVNRFNLPVSIYTNDKNPDLRELSISEIENLFLIEVERVFSQLPKPLKRIEN